MNFIQILLVQVLEKVGIYGPEGDIDTWVESFEEQHVRMAAQKVVEACRCMDIKGAHVAALELANIYLK